MLPDSLKLGSVLATAKPYFWFHRPYCRVQLVSKYLVCNLVNLQATVASLLTRTSATSAASSDVGRTSTADRVRVIGHKYPHKKIIKPFYWFNRLT